MLPEYFYRVAVRSSKGKLRTYEKGGGNYVREDHARAQLARLRRKGVECDLYVSPLNWSMLDQQPELEGQDALWEG